MFKASRILRETRWFFLANNFFIGPVGGVALVLRRLISHKTIRRLHILTILMQCFTLRVLIYYYRVV